MIRRHTLALLCAVVSLAMPAAASAEAPPALEVVRLKPALEAPKRTSAVDAEVDALLLRITNKETSMRTKILILTGCVLSLAGVKSDGDEIKRAVTFLVITQKEDGSWPMKRRGNPGVTPSDFIVPITYFGSAWATLGLMHAVPR